jgi:hypothetical protein
MGYNVPNVAHASRDSVVDARNCEAPGIRVGLPAVCNSLIWLIAFPASYNEADPEGRAQIGHFSVRVVPGIQAVNLNE